MWAGFHRPPGGSWRQAASGATRAECMDRLRAAAPGGAMQRVVLRLGGAGRPAAPFSAEDQPRDEKGRWTAGALSSALEAIPHGQEGYAAGFRVRRDGGRYRVETAKGYRSGTAAEIADHIRGELQRQESDRPRIDAALDRHKAAPPAPLLSEAFRREQDAFGRLPAGTRVVVAEGIYAGRTGSISRDAAGQNRVHLDGASAPVAVSAASVEPLDKKQSWRVPEAERPAKPKPPRQNALFSAGFAADDGRGRWVAPFAADDGAGQWVMVGGGPGPKGQRHCGGTPMFIKDGRVLKGAPSLVGKKIDALDEEGEHGTHRQQLKQGREHSRAVWAKTARKEGISPRDLHQLAGEMLEHDRATVADRTAALQSARRTIESYGGDWRRASRDAGKGIDATKTRGIDVAAERLARDYPHLFAGDEHPTDRLHDLLAGGNPEAMSEDDAYEQAMDHLREHAVPRTPKRKVARAADDDVPFSDDRGRLAPR